MNLRGFSQVLFRHGWKVLLPIFFVGAASPVFAQANLNILFTNGPASNRINIVVFSEGYKTNQLPQFLTNAAATVSNLLVTPPYNEYSNYFNAYAISVASVNSGANHSPSSYTNNTYFNSTYNSSGIGRLITIPPNSFDANYSHGTGKVQALLTNQTLYFATNLTIATNVLSQLTPSNRFLVLVVNDTVYGGSGQPPDPANLLPVAITSLGSSNNVSANEIISHESGHTLAGLADEYTNAYAAATLGEYPNATAHTNFSQIRWNAWINTDIVPIPTPADSSFALQVGLYQGAEYNVTGWYRPMEDCKMNELGAHIDFCPVCREAIVLAINQKVRVIDAFTPATNNLTLTTTQAFAFNVTTLQPTTHNLNLQWFTNGVAVTNATNSTFSLLPGNFTNGTHTLQLQTHDSTVITNSNFGNYPQLVLNDPNNYLSNSVSWNVTIGISSLKLTTPQLAGGHFSCVVTGVALNGFVMQGSTNFTAWTPLATNSLTNGVFNFTNIPGALPWRFYRAVAN